MRYVVDRLEEYFRGLLIQIIGICNLEHFGMFSTIHGLVITQEGQDIRIQAGKFRLILIDFGVSSYGQRQGQIQAQISTNT